MIDPVAELARLQDDLSQLDRAIASGVRTVESHTQGKTTYRDMAEMMTARGFLTGKIAAILGVVAPVAPQTRRVVINGRSGF